MDLVSVIVPVYNAERYLEKCLDSILNQSYRNLEVIIINDGSTDGSLDICYKLKKQDFRVSIINKKNTGVSDSRNTGIHCSKGKWITFVDADDYIERNYIEKLYDIAKSTDADLVLAGVKEHNNGNITEKRHKCKGWDLIVDKLCLYNGILCNKSDENEMVYPQLLGYPFSKLYSKKILNQVSFMEGISIREDALFNLEAINNAHKIIITDLALYNYIIHSQSAMGRFHKDYGEEVAKYLKYCKTFCENHSMKKNSYYVCTAYMYMMWLKAYVMHKDSGFSKKIIRKLIKESFECKLWEEAFHGVDYRNLTLPYKILKYLFINERCLGIRLLYWSSTVL